MALSLVLAESAAEIVPEGMRGHPEVRASARKRGRRPGGMLLDNSLHYAAMRGLADGHKRGRPDLVHFALLAATCTPLYMGGGGALRVYVHTAGGDVVELGERVRLPRSFDRFSGLLAGLLAGGGDGGGGLLRLRRGLGFGPLLEEIGPEIAVGLSSGGAPGTCAGAAARLASAGARGACLVVGGFQKGELSGEVRGRLDELLRVDGRPLESHVVLSRVLYEYEKTVFM